MLLWICKKMFIPSGCNFFSHMFCPAVALEPDTLYYYRCGDPSLRAMSKIYHFKTMPISSPKSYPKRIALVGDLGLTYNTTSTISHLMCNDPDLVILVGDVTYANLYLTNGTGSDCYSCSFPDTPIHETYQPRWDYWGRWNYLILNVIYLIFLHISLSNDKMLDAFSNFFNIINIVVLLINYVSETWLCSSNKKTFHIFKGFM